MTKKMYSVIFAGTPEFAVPCLQALLNDKQFNVELVITQPDRPAGRKQILTAPPVKVLAVNNDVPVIQPENINKHDLDSYKCDYLVVVAYGQILKQHILDLPKIAAVNIHPSLLPKWRGASPIQHTMLADDKETGVVIQEMALKMDAGPILATKTIRLTADDTSPELHQQLFDIGSRLLLSTLKDLPKSVPQDDSQATYCKKFSREDGIVDTANMTAEEIDRHVRALVPWPGVTCQLHGVNTKIIQTSLSPHDDAVEIECKDGSILYITELQEPGKTIVSGKDWWRGKQ